MFVWRFSEVASVKRLWVVIPTVVPHPRQLKIVGFNDRFGAVDVVDGLGTVGREAVVGVAVEREAVVEAFGWLGDRSVFSEEKDGRTYGFRRMVGPELGGEEELELELEVVELVLELVVVELVLELFARELCGVLSGSGGPLFPEELSEGEQLVVAGVGK